MAIFLLGFSSSIVVAQGEQILNRFDALAIDGQVQLTCVISSGNTCNGINVYRSEDNIAFHLIGNIAGICGSTSAPVQYDFVDEQPLINQTSYYKLDFGGVGFTDAISVTIRDLQTDEVRIQPNPAQFETTIYFSNPSFATHTLRIVSYKGESLLEVSTTDDFFMVDVSHFPTGIYPIVITVSETNERKYKILVVQH